MVRIKIAGIGSYLPSRRVHNNELAQVLETSDEWIVSHTGISHRHLADENDSATSMGVTASKIALQRAGIAPEQLGTILLSTTTMDYAPIPSTACLIQRELKASNSVAFDISAACCGFVYGLQILKGFMQFDPRPTLLVGSELMSRILDWNDQKTCVLFGDGAGAAVLVRDEGPPEFRNGTPGRFRPGIVDTFMKANGAGSDVLRIDGGSRTPQSRYESTTSTLYMEGRSVFTFAIQVIPEVINALLERNGLTLDEIDWIVPHQANYRIIKSAATRLKLPIERFFINIDEVANTASASMPIALDEMQEKGLIKPGSKIITVGFGAGLTYGGNLIVW